MKTPRANRRRRTPRGKKLRGGATDAEMGYHLGSDVLHDFGAFYKNHPEVNYHIPGTEITPNEDEVVSYFEANPDIAGRRVASTKFTVPKNTTSFASWTPPELHAVGNINVGIVHDAGDKITKQLGAKNVITFGSVLDPAGKPIDKKDEPIWFSPDVSTVNIPLNIFGFDPAKLTSLEITNFTGNGTCATFHIGDKSIDAVSTKELGDEEAVQCKQKPINKTTASTAGYFVSIKEAKTEVGRLLAAALNGASPQPYKERARLYLAGKTLGDTMLVASCMQKFGDDVPNPFYPSAGKWSHLPADADAVMEPPTQLILKTQDRLNHVRALAMGVPSILQSRMGYEYVPAVLNAEEQRTVFQVGYKRLGEALNNRYQYLIDRFKAALTDEKLKPEYSIIADKQFIKEGETYKLKAAGRIIVQIIGALQTLQARVNASYDIENKEPKKVAYEDLYKKYNKCAPATAEIWDDAIGMHRHIIVSTSKGEPISQKIMIDLMTDFQNISRLRDAAAADEYQSKGEALRSLFNEEQRAVIPQPVDPISTADEEYVNLLTEGASSAVSGVAMTEDDIKENDGTLVNDFVNYTRGTASIGDLRNNKRVIDIALRDELLAQYSQFVDADIPSTGGGGYSPIPNRTTILFNAFVCSLNAENSILDSERDFLYNYFKTLEDIFIKAAESVAGAAARATTARSGNEGVATLMDDGSYVSSDEEAVAAHSRATRTPPRARSAQAVEARRSVPEEMQKLAVLVRDYERAKTYKAGEGGEGGISQAGLKRLFERVQAAYVEYMKRNGRDEIRDLNEGGKAYNDLLQRLEIRSVRQGGTRRKKRAGTYRKKRKDKGTL